jgi:uncharacterized protein
MKRGMSNPSRPLSEREKKALDAFLRSDETPEGTMWLDELDGFIAALVCAPNMVVPSRWMPVMWDGEEPEWGSLEEAQKTMGLLMRHWNGVAEALNKGTYVPLIAASKGETGETIDDPSGWCDGFIEGVHMWDADRDLMEHKSLKSLLAPIVALSSGEHSERVIAELDKSGVRDELIGMLGESAVSLRAFWQEHAPLPASPPVPPNRTGPSKRPPGRNAPCPCGSGKKYKNCCGAPA